jgi:hypothetical protein
LLYFTRFHFVFIAFQKLQLKATVPSIIAALIVTSVMETDGLNGELKAFWTKGQTFHTLMVFGNSQLVFHRSLCQNDTAPPQYKQNFSLPKKYIFLITVFFER